MTAIIDDIFDESQRLDFEDDDLIIRVDMEPPDAGAMIAMMAISAQFVWRMLLDTHTWYHIFG